MARAIAVLSGSTAALRHNPLGLLGHRLAAVWRLMTHDTAHPYRPERYYMRGPGPAWQAKHGSKPQA